MIVNKFKSQTLVICRCIILGINIFGGLAQMVERSLSM